MKNHLNTYSIWYILILFLVLSFAVWAYYDVQITKIDQQIESHKKQ